MGMRKFVMLAVAVLEGCGTAPDQNAPASSMPTIATAIVAARTGTSEIVAPGTAVWRSETPLAFTTAGQIDRILVNEGDRVQKGQLLAVLKTTPVAADLAAAEAEAQRARLEAGRIETLYKQGWATASRAEAAQASSRAADAAVRSRRFSLQTARIIAPGSGVILARTAEPDQVVAAASPVLVLGEADRGFVLRVPLNDRAAARIAPGSAARVTLDALGNAPLAGRVVEIGGRAARSTGTFDAKIALPADLRIRSGMIGTAHIATSAPGAASRIVLPADALLSPRAGEALVYVVASGKARLRTVRIGDTTDDGVEIIGGLAAGEQVALSGFERLRDGLAVRTAAPAR